MSVNYLDQTGLSYLWQKIKAKLSGKIDDVKINNTSVVSNGVANIPLATSSTNGVMSATDKAHLDSVYDDYSTALIALNGEG